MVMFDKILIKSKSLNDNSLDISSIIDAMLFYNKVILLVRKEEITELIHRLGPQLLEELIKAGRIELKIQMNIFGVPMYPSEEKDRYSIGTYSIQHEKTHDRLLYSAHREIVKNSTKNLKFSEKFSKISEPYRFEPDIVDRMLEDLKSKSLIKKTLPIYFEKKVPTYKLPEKIEIEIRKAQKFQGFDTYSFDSNLDWDEINELHKSKVGEENFHPLNYSEFLLVLAESQGDIYLSSQFESEIVTRDMYSKFIEAQLQDIIQRRLNAQNNIDLFNECVLNDCYSLGNAFIKGVISSKELLDLLDKADNFRGWLKNVPEDIGVLGEYQKAIARKELKDKLPTKTTRFLIFEGIGIIADALGAGGAGTFAAGLLSAVDQFYLDQLLKGKWKPNHYVDDTLKPKIKRHHV